MTTDINEGVWDSLKNKASMLGNSFRAAAGDSSADGKLRIQKVATTLYSGYKKFLGSSTGKPDKVTLQKFMKQETVLQDRFIAHWVGMFGAYLNMDPSERKDFRKSYNYSGDNDLTVTVAKQQSNQSNQSADVETPNIVDIDYDAIAINNPDIWDSPEFKNLSHNLPSSVTKHFNSSKWQQMIRADGEYTPSVKIDGSVVYAKNEHNANVIKVMMEKNHNPTQLMERLYDAGLLIDINQFASINSSYGGSKEEMIRDGLMTAAYHIGRNHNQFIDRLVMMVPRIAMNFKPISSGGLKNVRILDLNTNTLMEAVGDKLSDQELRDFLMMVARSAFLSGYMPSNGIAESLAESINDDALSFIDSIVEDATTTAVDVATLPSYLGLDSRKGINKEDNQSKRK